MEVKSEKEHTGKGGGFHVVEGNCCRIRGSDVLEKWKELAVNPMLRKVGDSGTGGYHGVGERIAEGGRAVERGPVMIASVTVTGVVVAYGMTSVRVADVLTVTGVVVTEGITRRCRHY
jgi:hypothetical protein